MGHGPGEKIMRTSWLWTLTMAALLAAGAAWADDEKDDEKQG